MKYILLLHAAWNPEVDVTLLESWAESDENRSAAATRPICARPASRPAWQMPHTEAENLPTDGPFIETKEHVIGPPLPADR
ncbi:hypothetical protein IFM12275_24360 [Nocardia sputorum]|nr:hypothetical protein IFM12275_24360 [Nocardia sputorum]